MRDRTAAQTLSASQERVNGRNRQMEEKQMGIY